MRNSGATGAPGGALADWRRRRLIAAGLPAEVARHVSATPKIDLHELLELIDRGCPPRLAVRILAPLDEAPPC